MMDFQSITKSSAEGLLDTVAASRSFQVAGVDGCKGGWVVAVASAMEVATVAGSAVVCKLQGLFLAQEFAEVVSKSEQFEMICVDIPIGLSNAVPRACDIAARKILGGRRASTVFPAPIRPCLCAKDYDKASKISFERSGKKLSKQSFAILAKIREVDDLMTVSLQTRIREIHPEISFWALNNKTPVAHNKKAVLGQAQRHKLLQ